MKVELKEPIKGIKNKILKIFNNEPFLEKNKGENILFMGTTGSGKSETMISFYNVLMKNNIIKDKSIYIDIQSHIMFFNSIISIINKNNDSKSKVFNFCNPKDLNELNEFNNINFNNKNIKNILEENHKLFLYPNINQTSLLSGLFNYLINLPKNKSENEIPIFFEDLSIFKNSNDYKILYRLIKILNKKGYFCVCGIRDYNVMLKPEELMINLENIFEHAFIMKLEIHSEKYLKEYFSQLAKPIMYLNLGEYYYFKKFNVTHKELRRFPYELKDNEKNKLINYDLLKSKEIKNKAQQIKINNF